MVRKVLEAIEDVVVWVWEKLATDTFARGFAVGMTMLATWGWWSYWTKPVKFDGNMVTVDRVVYKSGKIVYVDTAGESHAQTMPPEGTATIGPNGLKVKRLGLCLIPFGGAVWAGEKLMPYGGIRFAYWNRFGLQAGLNNDMVFAGGDMRLPYLRNIYVAVGATSDYDSVATKEGWGLYLGAGLYLR